MTRKGSFINPVLFQEVMGAELKQVLQKLDVIKLELDYIKEHIVDSDTVLTPAEEARLEESLRDFKEGKTTSLEAFEAEMKAAHVKRRVR